MTDEIKCQCGSTNVGGSIHNDRVVAWYCFDCKRVWGSDAPVALPPRRRSTVSRGAVTTDD